MKKLLITMVFGILFAHAAQAAVLTIGAPDNAGRVAILLDTQGQTINAVEIHLSFDPSVFSVAGISDGGSVIDFWVQQPTFSNSAGTIDVSGITPGGFDNASATIATITIIPIHSASSTQFHIASATALLNDGKGTPASLTMVANSFLLTATSSTVPSSNMDTEPPDSFVPEIARDPAIFNDQYFLSFATTDQSSGINHYEVLEVGTGKGNNSSGWQVAQSPYLLEDQSLSSNIYVRAVDNAGNFRVVEVPAEHPASAGSSPWYSGILLYGVIAALILLLGISLFFMRQKKKLR